MAAMPVEVIVKMEPETKELIERLVKALEKIDGKESKAIAKAIADAMQAK
jgi:hypothetical protein